MYDRIFGSIDEKRSGKEEYELPLWIISEDYEIISFLPENDKIGIGVEVISSFKPLEVFSSLNMLKQYLHEINEKYEKLKKQKKAMETFFEEYPEYAI